MTITAFLVSLNNRPYAIVFWNPSF